MFLVLFALLALEPAPPPELFRPLDFDGAVAAAKTERKCALVVFTSAGSAAAKQLEMQTFPDPKVREWIVPKAVPIKLDADKNEALTTRLRIHTTPTTLFVNDAGREIDRITGYVDGRAFLEEAKAILGGRDPFERAKKRFDADTNDPHRRIDLALALLDRTEFEAALEQYLWCWDHGVSADPSFAATRRTFLLKELMRLGRLHPKAADALAERARAAYDKVVTCTAPEADLLDFLLLNHELQQDERTLAAYDALDSGSEGCAALRERLGPLIVDPLIDARRYTEAIERLGDPRERLTRMIADFRAESERLQKENKNEAFVAIDTNRRALRTKAARIYEALLGAKQYDDGGAYAKLLLTYDPSGGTHCALILAALRVQAHGEADALVKRALADPRLTTAEKDDVRKLATGIIQPK
jgi:thioredoxin-related protein